MGDIPVAFPIRDDEALEKVWAAPGVSWGAGPLRAWDHHLEAQVLWVTLSLPPFACPEPSQRAPGHAPRGVGMGISHFRTNEPGFVFPQKNSRSSGRAP